MKTIITRDDVTGAEVTDATEHKITIGDVSGTLDLSGDSYAAILALVNGEGSGKLAALLAPAAPVVKRSRKRSGGSTDDKSEIRAWAKSQGLTINERGRVPAEIVAKYNAAHAASTPAPASAPANTDTGNDTGTDPRTMTGTPASTPAANNASARRRGGKSADAAK